MKKVTDPIPVFPTPGAEPWTTRTPAAAEIEAATDNITSDPTIPPAVAEQAAAVIKAFLDQYGNRLEEVAMEVAFSEHRGDGILAIWHGSNYAICSSPEVPAGHLVEERCFCGRQV